MNHRFQFRIGQSAFTLLEMLVAIAVLSLLAVLLAQVVTLTSQAIATSTSKLDAVGQTRLLFDRLGNDLAARPRRADLGMVFTKATGNDSFQFYSQMDGYSGTRKVTSLGYRIKTTGVVISGLERGATGTYWAPASGQNSLAFLPQAMLSPGTADFEILADGVFRMEFCYLLNTGHLATTAKSDYSDVVGVMVAVAVLDAGSRKIVTDSQMNQLSTALTDVAGGQDPITDGCDPLTRWTADMAKPGFASGIAPRAVQNIRLYQRTFCVP